jgi:hypothetical protein
VRPTSRSRTSQIKVVAKALDAAEGLLKKAVVG